VRSEESEYFGSTVKGCIEFPAELAVPEKECTDRISVHMADGIIAMMLITSIVPIIFFFMLI
jgi:hypothetical protein